MLTTTLPEFSELDDLVELKSLQLVTDESAIYLNETRSLFAIRSNIHGHACEGAPTNDCIGLYDCVPTMTLMVLCKEDVYASAQWFCFFRVRLRSTSHSYLFFC